MQSSRLQFPSIPSIILVQSPLKRHLQSLGVCLPIYMTRLFLSSSFPRCSPPHRSVRSQLFQTNKGNMNPVKANPVSEGEFDQNLVVMRHGDRMDNFDPLWVKTAERPWDPPLVDAGRARAFSTGRQLRPNRLGFRIHRIFVSPFLRCIQTASEVATALCAADGDVTEETMKVATDCDAIDPSIVKVSIEYGLCEMLNREAIRLECFPKDGNFQFNTSELEGVLPAGTIDHTAERIFEELPQWEESILGARARYEQVIQALADKYPKENLLLVTHGEGVVTSVASFLKGAVAYQVDYCAYSHAKRHGSFELVTLPGEAGIKYYTE